MGAAFDRGIDIAAGLHISKTSDSKTLDQAVVDFDYRETTYQKKSHGKKRIQKSSRQSARVNRNRYTGSGNLDLHSRDDHTLGPIYAEMGQKARVSSEVGTMHMAGQKSSEAESSEKKSEDKFWKSTSSYGHVDEHLEQSQIHAAGGTEITGGKGVVIDRAREKHSHANGKKNKGKPRTHEHLRDDSTVAGQEWMRTPGATFNTVDELHQSWEFRNQGMTAAAKVVVTLLVMIATSGAGSFLAGGGAAGAGAGGAATAATASTASASLSIGQAVSQFAAQAATNIGFSASMAANIGAGVSAMACAGMAKAVVAGIDNRGNIVKTTKDLATKEQALDLAVTGVTAGATRGVGVKLGVDKIQGMSGIAARAGVKAGVRSTVRMATGEKPKAALRQSAGDFVAQVGAEVGAGYLKDMRINLSAGGDNIVVDSLHKAGHFANAFGNEYVGASIGGLRGSARENSALAAGIGAAAGEIYAERMGLAGIRAGTYDPHSKADQDRLSMQAQIAAALATGLAGKDANVGVKYAQNAVENNAVIALPFLAAAVEGTALGASLAFYGSAALTGIGLGFLVKNSMDAAPEASEPQVESFPEAEPGVQSFVTPVHESGPQIHSTPVHDQARPSDRGFDTYNGPDASVLTRDTKPVEVYEVGEYWDLSRRSRGDNLDIHHAPQAHPAKQAIDSYDRSTAPSMSLPLREHKRIPNIRGGYSGNSRDLLANDVRNLRTHTKAPNDRIQELINLTKNKYPESFKKE